jgi:uncharacterized protein YkwD
MKRLLWIALLGFVLCYGYILGAQQPERLFSTPVDLIPVTLPPLNPSIVLRERLVNVGFHLLADGDETTIYLNPFDDVLLTAVQERNERTAAGGYTWYGRVEAVPPAEVVLVVEDFKLAASVTQGDRKYTVRHVSGDLHLIREIDLSAVPTPSEAPRTLSSTLQATPSSFETEILTLVNQERAAQNLYSLSWDTELYDAAHSHSVDMATNNYFSHTSQDGRTFSDRIQAAGYQWSAAGENIAAGYSTLEAAMNGWMNSDGHRANILNSSYCDLGVGYSYNSGSTYGHYWTQDFGRKTGVFSCPSAGNQAPSASFTATPISGSQPLTVHFDASASTDPDGSIASFAWNFGDGQTGTGQKPDHVYTTAGTFTVTLTVTDDEGASDSLGRANLITVSNPSTGQYTLSIQVTGHGTVAMNPTGGSYAAGTAVTLTATPDSGWQLSGWSGDLTGSTNPATITMAANKTVTATFTETSNNDPAGGGGSGGGGGGCFIATAACGSGSAY